jgi:hypothetical protein
MENSNELTISYKDEFGTVTVVRHDVEDLYSLSHAYTDATKAIGFSYVESVGFEKDDGKMVFGDF